MIEQRSVHAVMCDGCGRTRYQELPTDVEFPHGFVGTVVDHTTNGMRAEWFACRQRCVAKAVANSVARRQEELAGGGGRP